ncbi:MAG TPA: hypothetical protein PKH79_03825 [Prolixibacteraceae bacterium]|nr:hypothetical protein [Prolixibacteraceae bacterium]HPS12959.1 hypothetical protein [Prolixibacteraceae bacterium]
MCNIRKRKINRAIGHTRRMVVFPRPETIVSVGFVLDVDADERNVTWNLQGTVARTQCLKYVDEKRGNDARQEVIFRSDLNFWKLPPDKLVRSFIETPFDLLINLASDKNDVITYICAASKAKFKVSYKQQGEIYDLVIDLGESNKTELVKQLKSTLLNLNQKETLSPKQKEIEF